MLDSFAKLSQVSVDPIVRFGVPFAGAIDVDFELHALPILYQGTAFGDGELRGGFKTFEDSCIKFGECFLDLIRIDA